MSIHSAALSDEERRVYQAYGGARFSAGFPACRLSSLAGPAQTQSTYANALLSTGHGYPLFYPLCVSHDDSDQDEVGIRLGDVGYFRGVGIFVSLFNIFQTKRTNRKYLPRQYAEIKPPLSEWEVRHAPDYFSPGTIIASEGISTTLVSSSPLKIKVSTNGPGSIVALPEGASRQEIVNVDALLPHIEQNALDWYRWANYYERDPDNRRVLNGDLCLITEVDIAAKWATAIIDDPTAAEFEYDGPSNQWKPMYGFGQQRYPSEEASCGNIFVRGLTIALGSALWSRYMPRVPPSRVSIYTLFTPCGNADLLLFDRWMLKIRGWLLRRRNETYHRPDTKPAHPALIFLQAILAQAPSANVLMVHDSIWSSSQGISLRYPDIFDHIIEILDRHVVKIIDGVGILTPKNESSQPTSAKRSTRLGKASFGKPQGEETRRRRRVELWRMVNHADPI